MKRLFRSRRNRMFAGICGGLAEYLHIDATVIRLLFVILLFVTGIFPFGILYLIGIYLIPSEGG